MVSDYDVVHYHCLGPALFSFLPRLAGKKTVVTVQGLDWQRGKWGRIASRVLRWGEAAAVSLCPTRPWWSRKRCSSTIVNDTTATPFTFRTEPR